MATMNAAIYYPSLFAIERVFFFFLRKYGLGYQQIEYRIDQIWIEFIYLFNWGKRR